jgi:aminoglycoside phosphotransferase (APT) family kinase protein
MTTPPFDIERLQQWLAARELCSGPIRLQRVGEGRSNLTYRVSDTNHSMILRRPPLPPLPPGGHDMAREVRVLTALRNRAVPIPEVLAVADPGEVMDVGCYVMTDLDGVVATDRLPPHLDTPTSRAALAESFIDILATLHRLDWRDIGLSDLGRPDAYLHRQLTRLPTLITIDGRLPARFGAQRDRLRDTQPTNPGGAVVHGDYRFGNLMLSRASQPPHAIIGVLDWELAGIGDPLADLGYALATFATPDEPPHALTAMSALTREPGFPTRTALAHRYAARTGADISRLNWYEAFALFRLAVLFEYNRRKSNRDPFYADPDLAAGLLAASEQRNIDAQSAI